MNDYRNDSGAGNTGITMAGFLLGAVVGAGIALLLAPGTGDETRRKLGETAKRIGSKASDIGSKANDMISHARERVAGTESFRGSETSSGMAGREA